MRVLLICVLFLATIEASALSKWEQSTKAYLAIASNEQLAKRFPHVVYGISPKQFDNAEGITGEYFVWFHSREQGKGRPPECVISVEVKNFGSSTNPSFAVTSIDENHCELKAQSTDTVESWLVLTSVLSNPSLLNNRINSSVNDISVSFNVDGTNIYNLTAWDKNGGICFVEAVTRDQQVARIDYTRCKSAQ